MTLKPKLVQGITAGYLVTFSGTPGMTMRPATRKEILVKVMMFVVKALMSSGEYGQWW